MRLLGTRPFKMLVLCQTARCSGHPECVIPENKAQAHLIEMDLDVLQHESY